ncbi:MAG TPA: TIM barrel protein [Armatimonadota bacterium]|jgi:sugar phosphate isomerase/epimerase
MQLAYPLEQFRTDFAHHVEFLKNCTVDQIPLYVMLGREAREHWFGAGTSLDYIADLLRDQVGEIRGQGLAIDLLYGGGGLAQTILDNPEEQEEWGFLCALSAQLDVKLLGLGLPNPPREEGDAAFMDNLVGGYQWLADRAADHGLRICSHHGVDFGRRFYNLEDYEELFDRIARPNCGLLFCFGNISLAEIDVPEAIRRLRQWVFAVHVRQTTGCFAGESEERQLHSGEVDLVACLRTLQEIGYDGVLHPEHFGKFSTAPAPESRDLWGQLGLEPDGATLAWNLAYLRGLMDAVL